MKKDIVMMTIENALKYTIKAKSITHPIEIRYQAIAGWNIPQRIWRTVFSKI